tara:strand:- start:187 stop:525 length:339 start_codon:yes stop_codon:yes gene_type:complete
MKTSIKKELSNYITETIQEIKKDDLLRGGKDMNELHHKLFNEDYYLIGYYNCEEWLKEHDLSTFEAIGIVQEWEQENYGECKIYTDAESLVNMLVFIYGEQLLYEVYQDKGW